MSKDYIEQIVEDYGEQILSWKMSTKRIATKFGITEADALEVRSSARSRKPSSYEDTTTEVDPDYLHSKPYYYNKVTDVYVFNISGVPKPLVLPGQIVRDIRRAYSSFDAEPATLNECSREFGLPRAWVVQILRMLGMTHDSLPFTDEEMLTRDDETLADEANQLRSASLYKRLERDKWRLVQNNALKWSKFDVNVLRPLIASIDNLPAKEPQRLDIADPVSPFLAVVGLSDLHHGKYADPKETGDGWNTDITRDRLFTCTREAIKRLSFFGRPEKLILPVGSDFLHVDTDNNTTTAGTPQDVDCTPAEALVTGFKLIEDYIEMLRQVAPVHLVLMSGNHDRMSGLAILLMLEALYRNAEDVTVELSYHCRQYVAYGNNLIAFYHGDNITKLSSLAGVMSTEAAEDWARPHKTVYTGHLHNEKTDTDSHYGVVRRQLPSLCGTDRWHSRHGYTGNVKTLPIYLHDKNDGIVAVVYGPVTK